MDTTAVYTQCCPGTASPGSVGCDEVSAASPSIHSPTAKHTKCPKLCRPSELDTSCYLILHTMARGRHLPASLPDRPFPQAPDCLCWKPLEDRKSKALPLCSRWKPLGAMHVVSCRTSMRNSSRQPECLLQTPAMDTAGSLSHSCGDADQAWRSGS
ncbi:hypothetical protein K437DRAFT_35086 [Tilletiaria anomala UBC 951]|uniref:Uncharacterized protein n=1 Tax=Tilletiaria anomala (strain ATCC 24038 / CBS 436.72 / UBC 951) TaxID=1037660 RepID=A0A066VC04_TILAU|nr:uncharacterized protein K437DRAFT_35086 [Tilletiaria anomala UBC 951]KDN37808.1 hypothetical protein K437DRAFT_35086 [Tilletiaria anomala UBC 951]